MAKELIGKITHFFDNIGVAVLELEGNLKVGDKITIETAAGEDSFTQEVSSMQVEHKSVDAAKSGDSVGLKVDQPVKENSKVFKGE